MKTDGFMGFISGNIYQIMILVGAEMQNVQDNYHHYDTMQSSAPKW